MIDIGAAIGREGHLLAQRSIAAQIPAQPRKGALRILPGGAQDREAVELYLETPAQPGIVDALAIIDGGERDRLSSLHVGGAQRLHRPAGDRKIAVARDPLGFHHGAQPIVAGDIVTAQEGLVGGQAGRARDRPVRPDLEAAVRIDIAAYVPIA